MDTFSTLEITNRVFFDPIEHKYTNYKGTYYESVTTFIHHFIPKKDWVAIAKNCCKNPKNKKYYGRDYQDVLNEWDKGKDEACERGTIFHEEKETGRLRLAAIVRPDYKKKWLGKVHRVIDYSKFTEAVVDMSTWPNGIYSELRTWNHEFEKAGTADTVIFEDEWFDIEDYKTNKVEKMTFSNYWNKMSYPIDHLDDCTFIHYELQLSIYAFFLEVLTGKKCRTLHLDYHPSIFNEVTKKWEISEHRYFFDKQQDKWVTGPDAPMMECRYLKKEVLSMLQFSKDPLSLL